MLRSAREWLVSFAIILAAATLVWRTFAEPARSSPTPGRQVQVPSDPVPLLGSKIGPRLAPVAMVVFTDFQCPYCGRFGRDTLPEIVTRYVDTGQLQIDVRHFPLKIHPEALPAAKAAVCADVQSKFRVFHDLLFARQSALRETDLAGYAAEVGLERKSFSHCVEESAQRIVDRDLEFAKQLGVVATPTFFIGTVDHARNTVRVTATVSGARPISDFVAALDTVIKRLE